MLVHCWCSWVAALYSRAAPVTLYDMPHKLTAHVVHIDNTQGH